MSCRQLTPTTDRASSSSDPLKGDKNFFITIGCDLGVRHLIKAYTLFATMIKLFAMRDNIFSFHE